MKTMTKIFILLVLLSQFSFAYEYSNSLKKGIVNGCLQAGASKQFCNCQLRTFQKRIAEYEIRSFQQALA